MIDDARTALPPDRPFQQERTHREGGRWWRCAPITELRLAEARARADAVPVDAHKPGDPHRYRITCKVCGARGTIRLTVDPETALVPAPSEPDDWDPRKPSRYV